MERVCGRRDDQGELLECEHAEASSCTVLDRDDVKESVYHIIKHAVTLYLDKLECDAELNESSYVTFWNSFGSELTSETWSYYYKDYINPEYVDSHGSLTLLPSDDRISDSSLAENSVSDSDAFWLKHWDDYWHSIYCISYEVFCEVLQKKQGKQEVIDSSLDQINVISNQLDDVSLNQIASNDIDSKRKKRIQNKSAQLRLQQQSDVSENNKASCISDEPHRSQSKDGLTTFEMPGSEAIANSSADFTKKERWKQRNNDLTLCFQQPFVTSQKSFYGKPQHWLTRYHQQRYRLFSRYDDGILLDDESWFSVTPEKIAYHQALRCSCDVIIDAFCGVGGNAIQFAKTCALVIAIDIDPHKIHMAKHNAHLYGVADRIEFIVADFFQICHRLQGDVVYLSPPWGGPGYSSFHAYDIYSMLPVNIVHLMQAARAITSDIAIFLPRNIDILKLLSFVEPDQCVEIEKNFLDSELKTATAYFGNLVGEGG